MLQLVTAVLRHRCAESPAWLDDHVGGQFYGYVTGTANLSCQAEAQPPPTFRWLDAENNPVKTGTIVNEEYKVDIYLHMFFTPYTLYSICTECIFISFKIVLELTLNSYKACLVSVGADAAGDPPRGVRGLHLHRGERARQAGEGGDAY